MFEWIVMGFFIGVPLLMMIGAFAAWLHQRRQDFSIDDIETTNRRDLSGGSPA